MIEWGIDPALLNHPFSKVEKLEKVETPPLEIPEGYQLLPATKRWIRINLDYIANPKDSPYMYGYPGSTVANLAKDIKILGPMVLVAGSRTVKKRKGWFRRLFESPGHSCLTGHIAEDLPTTREVGTVHIETDAPLLVK